MKHISYYHPDTDKRYLDEVQDEAYSPILAAWRRMGGDGEPYACPLHNE